MCKFNDIAGAATTSRGMVRTMQEHKKQPTPGGGGQDGVGQGQAQTPAAPSGESNWGGRKY